MAFQAFSTDERFHPGPSSFSRRYEHAAPPSAEPLPESSPYAPGRNRAAIAGVVLAHAAALYALIHFDVIAIDRVAPQHLAVTMIEVAPPPPPHEEARTAPAPKIETPIVAPPPVIAVQAPPPPVAAAPSLAEPVLAPQVVAAAAPVAAVSAPGPVAVNIMADILDAPAPRFPAESRRLRESGTVRLRVVVSTEGRVADVTVAKSSGFDRLDTAALDAIRKWRFRPRVIAGAAAEAVGFVPVTFNPPH